MTIIGKREGWRLSPFLLVFFAFDALYQRLSSSRSAVSPFLKVQESWSGGRGQLRLFAIGLLVRMMRDIVTSLPVKPGKFE